MSTEQSAPGSGVPNTREWQLQQHTLLQFLDRPEPDGLEEVYQFYKVFGHEPGSALMAVRHAREYDDRLETSSPTHEVIRFMTRGINVLYDMELQKVTEVSARYPMMFRNGLRARIGSLFVSFEPAVMGVTFSAENGEDRRTFLKLENGELCPTSEAVLFPVTDIGNAFTGKLGVTLLDFGQTNAHEYALNVKGTEDGDEVVVMYATPTLDVPYLTACLEGAGTGSQWQIHLVNTLMHIRHQLFRTPGETKGGLKTHEFSGKINPTGVNYSGEYSGSGLEPADALHGLFSTDSNGGRGRRSDLRTLWH